VVHEHLSFPELAPTRAAVAAAVAKVSAHPDAAATLGVSANLTAEIARNLVLHTAPALPASRVYSGVLYDALGYTDLDAAAKRRANRWLVVVSALYGAVRPTDAIAPYRLSMAVNLPGIGPLASAWKPELTAVLPQVAGRGVDAHGRPRRTLGAGPGAGRHPHGQAHEGSGRPGAVPVGPGRPPGARPGEAARGVVRRRAHRAEQGRATLDHRRHGSRMNRITR
jgi:hypothetical protein